MGEFNPIHQAGAVFDEGGCTLGLCGTKAFDLGAANAKLYFLAQAISFEIADQREIQKQVDGASWAVEDISNAHKTPKIGVVTLPPKGEGQAVDAYAAAKKVFTDLGAEVLDEQTMQPWANRMADLFSKEPQC